MDFIFKNNRHLSVGFALIFIGLLIKSLFAHNYQSWFTVKVASLVFLCLGLFVVCLKFFVTEKPKGGFFDALADKTLYYVATSFFILFSLIFIVMLEQIGKEINYSIRSYYLAKNTITQKAIIVDGKKLSVFQTGNDQFYIFYFKTENKTVEKGLLINYIKKDYNRHYDDETILINGKNIQVKNLLGKRVIIEVSKKYPSFFKMVSLDKKD